MQIYLVLIMLQAHSKLGPAKALALSVCLESLATVSIDVMGAGIVKFFQTNLEDTLGSITGTGCAEQGQGP